MSETTIPSTGKATRPVPILDTDSITATVLLVGGSRMVRAGLQQWLLNQGVSVSASLATEQDLLTALKSNGSGHDGVIVQLLPSNEAFATLRRLEGALDKARSVLPLVVLAEKVTRGQVYGALRMGSKAYVSLDAEPTELLKAISMAADDKVFLSDDAAELLVSDVSEATEPNGSGRLPSTNLSKREIEVVQLMCEGLSSKEIGRTLHISPKTVENHRYNIYRKCGIESVASLVRYAIQNGLVNV